MSPAGRAFDNTELLLYLAEIDAELPPGTLTEIAVIGGAAISFRNPDRLSDDVDIVSDGMPQELRGATATIAGPRYLLATKLLAGRDVDVDDAVHLAVDADVTTAAAMLDLLAEAYPATLLTPRIQYTAEVVAEDVAARLGRGVDL